jgi:hypothetical protein
MLALQVMGGIENFDMDFRRETRQDLSVKPKMIILVTHLWRQDFQA